jgi:hypothetical protein
VFELATGCFSDAGWNCRCGISDTLGENSGTVSPASAATLSALSVADRVLSYGG